MRRVASILFLSLSLSGLWGQLLHMLAPGRAIHGRPVPTCGGNANPDGGPCP
jgi:hypothetical protein